MPVPTLDTTIGGTAANSYVSVPTADAYHDAKLNTSAWSTAVADDKTRAPLMATERLQTENWIGNRVTTTQRLAWPRWGAEKRDGVGSGFGGYGGWWTYGEPYLTAEIPQPVKDAQCELALAFLEGFGDSAEASIDSFTADGLSVKLQSSGPAGSFPSTVLQLLAGLTAGHLLIRS